MDRRRVLIVGGGIAGLALAPMLARSGDEVEVVERERAWRSAGIGMYLPGNAARVLRAFGLERVRSFGRLQPTPSAPGRPRMRAPRPADRTRLHRTRSRCLAARNRRPAAPASAQTQQRPLTAPIHATRYFELPCRRPAIALRVSLRRRYAPDRDRVQRGVNRERNSEQLSDTENRAVEPNGTSKQRFGRVVVPAAAGSSPVAHPSEAPAKRAFRVSAPLGGRPAGSLTGSNPAD